MTLKSTFTLADIEKFIANSIERSQQAVLNAYKYAGEQFVIDARTNGNYNDITGNLRSSIGYIVLVNGELIAGNFERAGAGTGGDEGVAAGESFAAEFAENYPKGIVLICVAGMDYAAAVEAKGRDVITGSTLEIKAKIETLLKQI